MDYAESDKPSKRSMYRQRAKHLNTEEIFDDEDLPEDIAYFHRIFFEIWDIDRGITYQDVYFWQMIYGVSLASDIISMFRIASGKCNEYLRQKRKPKDKK